MKKILLIEDDTQLVDLIKIHLSDLHCEISSTSLGEDGLKKAIQQTFDLIILDIMLPDINGLEICRRIRIQNTVTPILMLTAKTEEMDKVLGLELGADDYMTKPFSIREFIARVKAVFRRSEVSQNRTDKNQQQILLFDGLHIEPEKRKVVVDTKQVELTPKEFELLLLLASHPGHSYSRKELLSLVWGYEFEGYEHTVTAHINRLRIKIEVDFSNPSLILTTWGVGYRFTDSLNKQIND
jgi:DNA-binding response OmpR family regulator